MRETIINALNLLIAIAIIWFLGQRALDAPMKAIDWELIGFVAVAAVTVFLLHTRAPRV